MRRITTAPLLGGLMLLAILAKAGIASAQPKSSRNVYDLLSLLYGIPNAPACSITYATVGTSASRVLLSDPRSVSVFIQNLSSGSCQVGYNGQVSTTQGVLIGSSGGFISEDYRVDMVLQTYEHWAVCTNASETLVVERCDLQ